MSQIIIKNRIDHKMLIATLAVQTISGNDDAMIVYIREHLKDLDVIVQEDGFGNIYVTKGKSKMYPCIISHTDTVQSIVNQMEIYRTGDTLFAFDPIKRHQCGIGGDDKVGVYLTLQFLIDYPTMKAVFFREEEGGCYGSSYAMENHKEWFNDIGYVIGVDRRGNKDVVTVSGGLLIASDEYLNTTEKLHEKYGYVECIGLFSDVDTLTTYDIGVSCVNYSCGYHEPHSSRETVSIKDVNKCYNLVYDILVAFPDRKFSYTAPVAKPKITKYPTFGAVKEASEISGVIGPHMAIKPRQTKLHLPLVFNHKVSKYANFMEIDVLKNNKKIYAYKGIKALVLTGDTTCYGCNTPVSGNNHLFFLPFEGRMYCSKCNEFLENNKVPEYLKFLEVEDEGTTFVHSLYANGWLEKEHSIWNPKLVSWLSDELPF